MFYASTVFGIATMLIPVSGAKNCVMTPTEHDCMDYKYPYAEENLAMLCMNMKSMSGCSLRKQCKSGGAKGPMCESFSLLADVCGPSEGMQMMMGCKNYTKLCAANSMVKECKKKDAFTDLPSTMALKKLTLRTCGEMSMMDGCSTCTNTTCPDPLMSYADVCRSMPSMAECAAWKDFCKAAGDDLPAFCPTTSDYCSGRGSVMWNGFGFYSGPMQPCIIFLFQNVVITEEWQYALSIALILLSGIFFQLLTIVRRIFAKKCSSNLALYAPVEGVLLMLQQGWSYALMFLAMTYRMDYFFTVVAGLGVGRMLVVVHKGTSKDDSDMMSDDTNTACCVNNDGSSRRKSKTPPSLQVGGDVECYGTSLIEEDHESGRSGSPSKPMNPVIQLPNHYADANVTLRVEGMMCMANCGTTVLNALRGLAGVVKAEMQFEKKLVHVYTDMSAVQLIEAIEEVGFEAEQVKASSNV